MVIGGWLPCVMLLGINIFLNIPLTPNPFSFKDLPMKTEIPLYELMQIMARSFKQHYKNQSNVEITVSNLVFNKVVEELRKHENIDEHYVRIGLAKSISFPIAHYEGNFVLKKAIPLATDEDVML